MDDQQEAEARASKAHQETIERFTHPIATEITRAKEFWRAEDYHQRYLEKRGLASNEERTDRRTRTRAVGGTGMIALGATSRQFDKVEP